MLSCQIVNFSIYVEESNEGFTLTDQTVSQHVENNIKNLIPNSTYRIKFINILVEERVIKLLVELSKTHKIYFDINLTLARLTNLSLRELSLGLRCNHFTSLTLSEDTLRNVENDYSLVDSDVVAKLPTIYISKKFGPKSVKFIFMIDFPVHLIFSDIEFSDLSAFRFFCLQLKASRLLSLISIISSKIPEAYLLEFFNSLETNTSVTSLIIGGVFDAFHQRCILTDQCAVALANTLRLNPRIRRLECCMGEKITVNSARMLGSSIENHSTLSSITLLDLMMTEDVASELFTGIGKSQSLRKVSLQYMCHLENHKLILMLLLRALTGNESVQVVEYNGHVIDQDVVRQLENTLQVNYSLSQLRLGRIEENDFKSITPFLNRNQERYRASQVLLYSLFGRSVDNLAMDFANLDQSIELRSLDLK